MEFTEGVDYKVISKEFDYRLLKQQSYATGIIPPKVINHPYFSLNSKGILTVKAGYEWDGATHGVDTKDFMRGSLFHDCLYQMLRMQTLPMSYRKQADEMLYKIIKEDGMSALRSWYVYRVVRTFGGFF